MRKSFLLLLAAPGFASGLTITQADLQVLPTRFEHTFEGYGLSFTSVQGAFGFDSSDPAHDGLVIGFYGTDQFSLNFDSAVQNLTLKFTAHSFSNSGWEEWWDNFTADGDTAEISLSDNGLPFHATTLEGGAVKPLVNDGWGTIHFAGSVQNVSFRHNIVLGNPGGTVLTEISWNPVPEPASFAVLGLGMCLFRRKRR